MLRWLLSFWWSPPPSPEKRQPEELEKSLSQWTLLEGPADELARQAVESAAINRRNEIRSIVERREEEERGLKNFDQVFAELLEISRPEFERKLINEVKLPNDVRSAILSTLLKNNGDSWLVQLEVIYLSHKKDLKDYDAALKELKESWHETPFAKGHLGAIRDFAMLSYPEAPLTIKVLRDIHKSFSRSLQRILRVNLECDFERDDVLRIEELLILAIKELVLLHVQAAMNIRKTVDKVGKLPARWREEKEKEEARLAQIKLQGTDAKWEGYKKVTVDSIVKSSLSPDEKSETKKRLEALFGRSDRLMAPLQKSPIKPKFAIAIQPTANLQAEDEKSEEESRPSMQARRAMLARVLFG